jgi:plasmid stability protein
MASLTIRNIPEDTKRRFRQLAAANGRSMEEQMRQLLLQSVGMESSPSSVREGRAEFADRSQDARPSAKDEQGEDWVHELVRIANGAGDGVFDPEPQPLREFDL